MATQRPIKMANHPTGSAADDGTRERLENLVMARPGGGLAFGGLVIVGWLGMTIQFFGIAVDVRSECADLPFPCLVGSAAFRMGDPSPILCRALCLIC